MEHLSKISPAESLMVLEEGNATVKELFKTTLFDLLIKQVLKTTELRKESNRREKARIIKYIKASNKFHNHIAKPHEDVFLAPYIKANSIKILFRHVVKMGYQNAKSEKKFKNSIINNPYITKCFNRNIFQKLIGSFSFNQTGTLLKKELQNEIAKLEVELTNLITTDKLKAASIVKTIGGNIFLLKNIDIELLNQIDKDLLKELNKNKQKTGNDSGCDTGCFGSWDNYGDFSDSFDSVSFGGGEFGGGGAGGDFGDSGDSGCSGCSGCGGCGGD